jgi:hypothetical protein
VGNVAQAAGGILTIPPMLSDWVKSPSERGILRRKLNIVLFRTFGRQLAADRALLCVKEKFRRDG